MTDDGLTLRAARRSDVSDAAAVQLAAVLAAHGEIFPAEASEPALADLEPLWGELVADRSCDVVVATAASGIVIGAVAVRPTDDAPGGVLLDHLYVDPRHWGRGVGTRLHDEAVDRARTRGATRLDLWVLEANDRARALYERWGWTLVPDRIQLHPAGVAEVGYRLVL
jgi:GNAT superfamily N-acetyltransferase